MQKILLIILYFSFSVFAQDQVFSLQDAISYSKKNFEEIKKLKIDKNISLEKEIQTKSAFLPKVNANADLRDNLVLQTTLLPGTLKGLPEDQRIPVQFGTTYNFTLGLDVAYNLLDPTRKINRTAAEYNTELAQNQIDQTILNISVLTAKAYYSVLANIEKKKILENSLVRLNKILEDAQNLLKTGLIQSIEIEKANYNIQNQLAEIEKANQAIDRAYLTLNYYLGLPLNQKIILSDSLLLNSQEVLTYEDKLLSSSPNARLDYKNLKIQLKSDELSLIKAKKAYLPTISLYGYFGIQSFRNKFDFYDPKKQWFPASYIGIKINQTLFDGFNRNSNVKQTQMSISSRKSAISSIEKNIEYETNLSYNQIFDQLKNIQIRKNNSNLAEKIYENAKNRFKLGLTTSKDVTDALISYNDSKIQELIAKYEYSIAIIDFEKSKGSFR